MVLPLRATDAVAGVLVALRPVGAQPELRTSAQYSGPLSVIDVALADHAEAVVWEAVSNAVRHASAATLNVNVSVSDNLCIEVVDDG